MRALPLLLLLAIASCTPSTVPPAPDASPASAACSNLAKAGCALGRDPQCPGRVELAVTEHHTTLEKITCIANAAPTKEAIVECHSPYFACP